MSQNSYDYWKLMQSTKAPPKKPAKFDAVGEPFQFKGATYQRQKSGEIAIIRRASNDPLGGK